MITSTNNLIEIGQVITLSDSPSTKKADFVLKSHHVNTFKGEIVTIMDSSKVTRSFNGNYRRILAQVTEIRKINAYYQSVEAGHVLDALETSRSFEATFPVDQWEYVLCTTNLLGELIWNEERQSHLVRKVKFPISPGSKVTKSDPQILQTFFGFDPNGLHLGQMDTRNTPVKVSLDRLLRKHLAILAISGAGKSHTATVLLEELMRRSPESGCIGIVVIDPHGEYNAFEDAEEFQGRVNLYRGHDIYLSVPRLHAWDFKSFLPDMSYVQARELDNLILELKKTHGSYSLEMLIKAAESIENQRTREALIGWLTTLQRTRRFSIDENPPLEITCSSARNMTIFDLSDILDDRTKQIITAYLLKRLFYLRRKQKIPPMLALIEEAHQFCPEGRSAISSTIIETIAREGRKFHMALCLISQRPVKLSVTALSQCNTHLIMRIRNPSDLDYIGKTSEGIDRASLQVLPDLDVGEGVLVGNAVNYPLFFRVRQKTIPDSRFERTMEEEARRYYQMT